MYPSALEMLEEAQEGSAKGDDVSKCDRDAGGCSGRISQRR